MPWCVPAVGTYNGVEPFRAIAKIFGGGESVESVLPYACPNIQHVLYIVGMT